ncbi:protein WBSCR14 homolog isoform X2 [Planococcus citri]|uniref:protein WBSCR14 homolog isoform X2 n=1 Tax=Planococcus citri TaxID=170843 RepID=UPI0031F82127
MCRNMTTLMAQERNIIQTRAVQKETIHSGHFMVSHFEADAQDDEYEVAVPVPEVSSKKLEIIPRRQRINSAPKIMSVSIETSLTQLFQCMSIAYRQKLTSPKWNRFKGVRLKWKEKIRLNNVIWRCWHMQFVMKQNIGVCQFASPLDVDIHSKPEAVVLEGKYWKRKLSAVTAEYKRWRMSYQKSPLSPTTEQDMLTETLDWSSTSIIHDSAMMVDEDYMDFMSDTLFTTIAANQPFAFPDTREIARGASLADFIQPSLVQLQPNLDDYMDMLEPLHDLLSPSTKLPSVPEEYHPSDDLYRSLNVNYDDVSQSSFYQQATNATMNSSSTGMTTATSNNADQKFYLKSDPDQPLQLSIQHDVNSKVGYRNNAMYHEPNVNNSVYNQNNNNANYIPYSSQNYHQSAQHQTHQDSIVNYSHQSSIKNASSSVPINYNSNSMMSNHHYGSYESASSYNASTGNVQAAYSPSTSSNYKILSTSRSSRSSSLPMNSEEEMFAVPKLSQRGRSRSGSSLFNIQNRYLPSEQSSSDAVTSSTLLTQLLTTNRHYGYHGSYQLANCSTSGSNNYGMMVCDSRTCCTIHDSHRQVPHCTALLGRRSRTPDHVLSSNSNPVGYCKPRTPLVSSQSYGEGSLINLSNNQREDAASERDYYPGDSANSAANSSGALALSCSRRHSQCVTKTPYDKYSATSPTYPGPNRTTATIGSYHSMNMPSSPSPNSPFVFNATQQSNSGVDMSPSPSSSSNMMQMVNNTSTSSSPKLPSSPSTSESLSLSPLTVSSPIRTTPSSPTTKSSSSTPYKFYFCLLHRNIVEFVISTLSKNEDVILKMDSILCTCLYLI